MPGLTAALIEAAIIIVVITGALIIAAFVEYMLVHRK